MRMFIKNELFYEIEELKNLGLNAVYSTVKAGCPAPFNSSTGLEDLKKLVKTLGQENKILVYAKQTHSDKIVILKEKIEDEYLEVDGFVTDRKDILLATFYADCLPIYIYDKKREIIGLCHSGWVGTHKGIGSKLLDIFLNHYKSDISDLVVVLGIGIGHCCYEVSQDFYEKFSEISSEALLKKSFHKKNDKLYFNNEDYNYYNFLNLGVQNIHKSNLCTFCNSDFHSYRRDGQNSGRNVALLGFLGTI